MTARVLSQRCHKNNIVYRTQHIRRQDIFFSLFSKGEDPDSPVFDPPPLPDGSRIDLPVLIMASNRPQYLFRMLQSLRRVQGLNAAMVTVFIDGFFEEPALLAGLYKLKVDQHEGISKRNARIAQVQCEVLKMMISRKDISNYEKLQTLKIVTFSLTNRILKQQCC